MEASSPQLSQELKPAERLQQLLPNLFVPTTVSGEQFLRIQLAPELIIAIPLSWVEETLIVSPQWLTPMPNMASHVLGLMSSKGQVFWGVNLARLLKLPIGLMPSQNYEVVVIRVFSPDATEEMAGEVLFLGLIVPKILGAVRFTLDDIVSPKTEVDLNLQPYLSGQVVVDGQTILVLSAEAIGNSQLSTAG